MEIIAMKFNSFSKCPGFHFWDIFLDVLLLYNKNETLDTHKHIPNNEWSELQKKQPMDYNNVESLV